MANIEAAWVFIVLGPMFLLLGAIRAIVARDVVPQARSWLLLGAIFTAVGIWLRTHV